MNLLNSRVGGGEVQLEVRIYTPWIRNISLSGSVIGQIQIPQAKFGPKPANYLFTNKGEKYRPKTHRTKIRLFSLVLKDPYVLKISINIKWIISTVCK
jgi:hypothetical protein